MIKFYDTSTLLQLKDKAFEVNKIFYISSITLEELEHIKTSNYQNNELKYAVRVVARLLSNYTDRYEVVQYKKRYSLSFKLKGYEISNDIKILSCAKYIKDCEFITADLNLYLIAQTAVKYSVLYQSPREKEYKGYKELWLTDQEIAELYTPAAENKYDLLTNEYIIIKNVEGDRIIDLLCWDGTGYRHIDASPINSKFFGKIKPYNGDIFQKFALDSLRTHQLTVLRGAAGTGKSQLSLTYLYSLLEKGEITRLYILANPVATRDAAQLGFYSGSRTEKLMDSQTGNFLISKFGDPCIVEDLVEKGKIMLLPFADIRGVSIPSGSAMYITEAQNSNIALMKLALQRAEEGVKVVIEGDDKSQVDMRSYEQDNNGLKRLSEVFRGKDFYSEVKLENCYRSRIAETAERM